MSEVRFDIGDFKRLSKALKKAAGDDLKDFTVPNLRFVVYLDSVIQRNFKSDGALFGGWIPFKYGGRVVSKDTRGATWDGRRWIDTSAKLLRDTGNLRAHFDVNDKGDRIATPTTAGIINRVGYADKHHLGLDGAPKRRLLPRINDVYQKAIENYELYIAEVAAKTKARVKQQSKK